MTDEQRSTYEIHLQGEPPDCLSQEFEPLRVSRSRTQTALFRRVQSPVELDALLTSLTSLGLKVAEVHEQRLPDVREDAPVGSGDTPRNYEVRVDGRLGETFLRFLRWRHCVVPEQTSVRVDTDPEGVLRIIARCSALGLRVERVRRVTGADQPR